MKNILALVLQGLYTRAVPIPKMPYNCIISLAHLSRRLIGELLVYRGIRRRVGNRPVNMSIDQTSGQYRF